MKIYIMNSAMMPKAGFYQRIDLSIQGWVSLYNSATEIVSTVAYPELIELMASHTGVNIPLAIGKPLTQFINEDGSPEQEATILVMKLAFRVAAHRKGYNLGSKIDDYEFILVKYKANA